MIAATKEHVSMVEQSKRTQHRQSFHSMNMQISQPFLYITSSESNFRDVLPSVLEAKGIQLLQCEDKRQLLPPLSSSRCPGLSPGIYTTLLTLCLDTDVPTWRRCTTLTDSVGCRFSLMLPPDERYRGKPTKISRERWGNFESCPYPFGHVTLLSIACVCVCARVCIHI